MRKTLVLLLVVLALASVSAFTTDCSGLHISDLVTAGGASNGTSCSVSDKTFSNFTFTATASGGATVVLAGDVRITGAISGNSVGLTFGLPTLFASGKQVNNVLITFDVAVSSGPAQIEDASLLQTGYVNAPALPPLEKRCAWADCRDSAPVAL